MVNALKKGEQVLLSIMSSTAIGSLVETGACLWKIRFALNHEQYSHWQQINPLHKRMFSHRFYKFGIEK